jgi:hypothetical protein
MIPWESWAGEKVYSRPVWKTLIDFTDGGFLGGRSRFGVSIAL